MTDETELERLRDRVAELEELLGLKIEKPRPINIGLMPWKMLGLLVRQPMVTREFAFRAIYGHRPETDQPTSMNIISTLVRRVRRSLRPYGVVVSTEVHTGYFMDEDSRERAKKILAGDKTEPGKSIDVASRGIGDRGSLTGKIRPREHSAADRPFMGVATNGMAPSRHD